MPCYALCKRALSLLRMLTIAAVHMYSLHPPPCASGCVLQRSRVALRAREVRLSDSFRTVRWLRAIEVDVRSVGAIAAVFIIHLVQMFTRQNTKLIKFVLAGDGLFDPSTFRVMFDYENIDFDKLNLSDHSASRIYFYKIAHIM